MAVLLGGCSAVVWPVPEERPLPPAAGPADVEHDIARLNAEARKGAVTDTLHGVAVEDPYRALEADTPATRAWIEAQTARTEKTLAALEDPRTAARLEALLGIGYLDGVSVGGARLFVTMREGKR